MTAPLIGGDARLSALRHVLEDRPVERLPRAPQTREAAVTLLVRPTQPLELLLIKRAEQASDPWSGHMALPGGRREPGDRTLLETAVRETFEETGISVGRDGVLLGHLDEVGPRSPRLPPMVIAPFVAAVPPTTLAEPNPREVDAALWVPLTALQDDGAVSEILIELEDGRRAFPSLRYGEYIIWGLTHRILTQFLMLADVCGL